ncbi:MAG: response regulator [Phycisphaeraceae bacterium]|nr:response regulator [Phycisphaeraceae bacterium]
MSLRILIVDDSPIIRSVIEKNIKLAELPVTECMHAGNGQEALNQLDGEWVDLALVDINMPVMNGVELIEKMKQDDLLKTIPVIVASTEGSQTRIDALKELGIAGYLRKPFTPEQFKEQITQVLELNDAA